MIDPRSSGEAAPGDQVNTEEPPSAHASGPTGAAPVDAAVADAAAPRREAAGAPRRKARRRWVGVLVWASVVPFAAWAALRLVPRDVHFEWIRAVAFTPYVALTAAAVPLLALLSRRWTALAVSMVVAATLAACVLPRAVEGGNPPAGGPRLRVLSANLKMGAVPPGELVALVRELRPDVLTLQELTPSAVKGLRAAGLGTLLPYEVDLAEPGAHGSGIYSRHPVAPEPPIPSGMFRQGAATVSVPGAPPVSVVSVHPCAPRYAERAGCWAEGLAALPLPGGGPVRILAGDFNATLDHARMRRLLDAGYRDAAATTGNGLTATWPYEPWHFNGWGIPPVTLDHILVDPGVAARSFDVRGLARTDHRAVFAELTLPGL
ncbi:endonuclease/exonuclease/phosphatase family protein [Microtetraspora niveoalba]|uniref:endonuclease/exonuclease/phosphatase family protein n=1 Tax=Microtetraspora niveoalba TaxID=46175 RepID=UPI000AC52999|nr:endonuclease/exonuclease/phosphatase family protein [Microtetraspora niveoalba]